MLPRLVLAGFGAILLVLSGCSRHADAPSGLQVREIQKLPIQQALSAQEQKESIQQFSDPDLAKRFYFKRVARYEVTALVAVKQNWFCCSARDDAMPLDLTLVWGPFSDTDAVNHFNIRHSGRFFFWNTPALLYKGQDVYHMAKHIANTHFVAVNPQLMEQLSDVPENSVVHIKGYLVNVYDNTDGSYVLSSQSRDDTGAGACEVVEVTSVRIVKLL